MSYGASTVDVDTGSKRFPVVHAWEQTISCVYPIKDQRREGGRKGDAQASEGGASVHQE